MDGLPSIEGRIKNRSTPIATSTYFLMTFGSLIPVCTPAGCRYFIPCLYSSCDLKENRRGNSLPQIPHTCCIFSACAWALTLWQTKFDIWLNPLPQSSHLYGLSFVWVNTWFLKLPDNGTVFNCCRLHYLRANYTYLLFVQAVSELLFPLFGLIDREKSCTIFKWLIGRINNLSNYSILLDSIEEIRSYSE